MIFEQGRGSGVMVAGVKELLLRLAFQAREGPNLHRHLLVKIIQDEGRKDFTFAQGTNDAFESPSSFSIASDSYWCHIMGVCEGAVGGNASHFGTYKKTDSTLMKNKITIKHT